IRLGDGARAEPLLRRIVESYARIDGAESPLALRARIRLSQALFIQQKYDAAIAEADAIYPALVRTLGPDHEATLALLGARAAAEGSLGRWDAAIRDDLTVYDVASRKPGPPSFYSIGMLADAALSQCRAGRFAEGETNARQAFDAAARGFGPRAGIA